MGVQRKQTELDNIEKIDRSIEYLIDLTKMIRSRNIDLNKSYNDAILKDAILKQVKLTIEQNNLQI